MAAACCAHRPTPDEARRLLPELTAAVLTGEALAHVMARTVMLPPACNVQCLEYDRCRHADHERLSEWLTGCLLGAEPTNRSPAMWALAECQEILRTEKAT